MAPPDSSKYSYIIVLLIAIFSFTGNYTVEHIDKVCLSLREQYGTCVKITGLLGRPDMLFVFEAGEVERVFRGEDAAPHRY